MEIAKCSIEAAQQLSSEAVMPMSRLIHVQVGCEPGGHTLHHGRTLRKDFAQMAQTRLTMPVLSIAGEKASATILGPQMKDVATDVKVIDLEGTGHWLMEERPKETIDALVAFL